MISPRPEVVSTPLAEHGGRLGLDSSARKPRYDFSVCLNAFGPADVVTEAIATARVDEYPDPQCRAPRRTAAERWSRPIDEIVFGAGAAELIFAVSFAFLRPGDSTLIATPAFGEYARATQLCGAFPIAAALYGEGDGVERFCRSIEQVRPRLAFVTAPSNPTGEILWVEDIRRIANAARDNDCLLVLDQAYDAFLDSPLGTPALAGHPSVFHLRSLTKDHALAGVRVAFGVAPPSVIDAIERVRVPWAASSASQAAGVAALGESAELHVAATTRRLRGEAIRIAAELEANGLKVRPSATHFFLVQCESARAVRDRLLVEHDILVRDCSSFDMPHSIRLAARQPTENDLLIAALSSVLA